MRIDKYLKTARILKRRQVAKELGDNGRLVVNGRIAKASTEVNVDDIIEIHFGHRVLKVKVLDVRSVVRKIDDPVYEVIEEIRISQKENE
ncbi:MAG: RNA-binding S4 domain-containing protein [Erysipelothrix sp.]|nr:RNA-binding S4 domain-containing protein [Erysipelothrix sp.]